MNKKTLRAVLLSWAFLCSFALADPTNDHGTHVTPPPPPVVIPPPPLG